MHLESKFTMSLVFSTTFFLFFFGGGGGGVLHHLVVQTDFEFKISGPLIYMHTQLTFDLPFQNIAFFPDFVRPIIHL